MTQSRPDLSENGRCGVYRQTFASSNILGIPDLIPELCWNPAPDVSLRVCGFNPLSASRGHVYAFWTEDFRFSSTWSKPLTMLDKIRRAEPAAMVEPDHSCNLEFPLCEQFHAIYRTRWTGRFWQEYGIPIIPNVTWSNWDSLEFSLLGIPRGVPVIAIEGRTRQRQNGDWFRVATEVCRRMEPDRVLLYGVDRATAERFPVPVLAFSAANPRCKTPQRIV